MEASQFPPQLQDRWIESVSEVDQIWLDPTRKKAESARYSVLAHPQAESRVGIRSRSDEKAIRMVALYAWPGYPVMRSFQRLQRLSTWAFHLQLNDALKRALDLLIVLSGLLFVLPFMLLTAIAIKLDSPGPVIFRQKRVGKYGKTFQCLKFRSMYIDAEERKKELMDQNEADEVVFKMKRDPRVTRVGRIIRKLSIDELPQIFNVLKGEMSLVGPRPPVPIELEYYQPDHFRRLEAVPGLTGLQQVSGRSELNFKRWVELDVQYIQEQSLWKDIEILLRTIPTVISGKGAY